MRNTVLALLALSVPLASTRRLPGSADTLLVVTADVDRFWETYDRVTAEPDSAEQVRLLDSLYVRRGTPGLQAMIERRDLTAADYVEVIRRYPRFWASVRPNTTRAAGHAREIAAGIGRLRALYPALRPARVCFTVGALRTNGMVLGDVVFIGSEVALADRATVTDEFPEGLQHLPTYFATPPSASVVFLNVRECVHTQQGTFGAGLIASVWLALRLRRARHQGGPRLAVRIGAAGLLPVPFALAVGYVMIRLITMA